MQVQHVSVLYYSLWLSNIPNGWYHMLFVCSSVDGHFEFSSFVIMKTHQNTKYCAALNMCTRFYLTASCLLVIFPIVELLNQIICLCLIFWETRTLFKKHINTSTLKNNTLWKVYSGLIHFELLMVNCEFMCFNLQNYVTLQKTLTKSLDFARVEF